MAAMSVAMPVVMTAMPAASAAAKRTPPPFCIDRGGFDGPGSTTRDCRYDDYESCLKAAAAKGNCVRNITPEWDPHPVMETNMKKRGRP
ncbi:MAG: DUF3551 domain-containing protein [Pseudomonadota bacterium]